jgi:hypothetical protein
MWHDRLQDDECEPYEPCEIYQFDTAIEMMRWVADNPAYYESLEDWINHGNPEKEDEEEYYQTDY